MKISKNFLREMQNLQALNTQLLSWSQYMEFKIPKLAGLQKFVKHYNRMSEEQKINFAPELKRRLIRQQIVFSHVAREKIFIASASPEIFECYSELFKRMNDVDGSRNVKLTPGLSTIGLR